MAAQSETDASQTTSTASNDNGNVASVGSKSGQDVDNNSAAASDSSNTKPVSSDSDSAPTPNDGSSSSELSKGSSSDSASVPSGSDSQVKSDSTPTTPSNPSPPSSTDGGSNKSEEQKTEAKKSGAIAGSVLGAAAALAAVGSLYAYKKRKESIYQSNDGSYHSRFGFVDGGKKSNAEPVSSLWLTTPVAWASKGLKRRSSETSSLGSSISGIFFKKNNRRGSNGSTSTTETLWEKGDKFTAPTSPPRVASTSPTKGLTVFRSISYSAKKNSGGRRNFSIGRHGRFPIEDSEAQLDSKVSEKFISSIVQDENRGLSPFSQSNDRSYFPSPPIAAAMVSRSPNLNSPERVLRAPSCESFGSDGEASHCSYPYLSAMHRPSLANLSSSNAGTRVGSEVSISREDANESSDETSPRELMLRKMVKAMRQEVEIENQDQSQDGRNRILNPFASPEDGVHSSDEDLDIESHLVEEEKLKFAHQRAMQVRGLASPSNQTDFASDDEDESSNFKSKASKSSMSPSAKIANSTLQSQNFQSPIFGWEPISKGLKNDSLAGVGAGGGRGRRLGAALLSGAIGKQTLLQSKTATLDPRDPSPLIFKSNSNSPFQRTPVQQETPLNVAAERAEMLIQMEDDSFDGNSVLVNNRQKERIRSEKRARKSLLRVTNES